MEEFREHLIDPTKLCPVNKIELKGQLDQVKKEEVADFVDKEERSRIHDAREYALLIAENKKEKERASVECKRIQRMYEDKELLPLDASRDACLSASSRNLTLEQVKVVARCKSDSLLRQLDDSVSLNHTSVFFKKEESFEHLEACDKQEGEKYTGKRGDPRIQHLFQIETTAELYKEAADLVFISKNPCETKT